MRWQESGRRADVVEWKGLKPWWVGCGKQQGMGVGVFQGLLLEGKVGIQDGRRRIL